MEGRTLLALLLCSCLAAVDAERYRRTVAGPPSDSKPGFEIITTLPESKPGFLLNRQFQNKAPLANDVHQPKENTGGVRQVVDSQGRHWVVAELPEPEPGFYFNRHVQNKGANLPSPANSINTNQVVFVKKNAESARREVVFPTTEEEQVPQPVAGGKLQRPAGVLQPKIPVILTLQPKKPATIQTITSSTQENTQANEFAQAHQPAGVLQPQLPVILTLQPQKPATTQTLTSSTQQGGQTGPIQGERDNVNKHTQKTVTEIGHPPEAKPTTHNTEAQSSGFSCEGKPFGYYADLDSGCQNYHVCNPISFGGGYVRHYKYSFTCTAGLIFDPVKKVCVPTTTASPCK